jgi:isochorismate pyruvate lyase
LKTPEECESIEEVRRSIDALDREVIARIDLRARYVEATAGFKTGESSVRAPERQRTMLDARRRWAEEEGLSPDVIEDIYRTLSSSSSAAN